MPIYSSIDRLNAMHTLFTQHGNQRLDRGEVEALGGFYGGLPEASQKKLRDRMIEIYETSKYSSGQRGNMLAVLESVGFELAELEGAAPDTAAGFAKLSRPAQLSQMIEIISGPDDQMKEVSLGSIDAALRGKIKAGIRKAEAAIAKRHGSEAIEFPAEVRALYVATPSGALELVGYACEVQIYLEDHDVDETHFFNLKGQHVGSEYTGE